MPKLPVLKDKELIKVLIRLGFKEHTESGNSHLVFRHTDRRRTTVARHPGKDILNDTLKGILRDIAISTDDLIKALKE